MTFIFKTMAKARQLLDRVYNATFVIIALFALSSPLQAQEDCIQLHYADTLNWSDENGSEIMLAAHKDLEIPSYSTELYGFLVRGVSSDCQKHFFADHASIVDICRDASSGKVYTVVHSGAGQHYDIRIWSVNLETGHPMEEYVEGWGDSYRWDGEQAIVGSDGRCLWKDRQAERQAVDDAVRALRIDEINNETVNLQDGQYLTVRQLNSDTVHRLLQSLEGVVDMEGAVYASSRDFAGWRVVQIRGKALCEALGSVIVLNRGTGEWYSIYDIASGCSDVLDYPLYGMYVRDGYLMVSACYDCSGVGSYHPYVINLNTWRVQIVEPGDPQWDDQWDRQYTANPVITDVGQAFFEK